MKYIRPKKRKENNTNRRQNEQRQTITHIDREKRKRRKQIKNVCISLKKCWRAATLFWNDGTNSHSRQHIYRPPNLQYVRCLCRLLLPIDVNENVHFGSFHAVVCFVFCRFFFCLLLFLLQLYFIQCFTFFYISYRHFLFDLMIWKPWLWTRRKNTVCEKIEHIAP